MPHRKEPKCKSLPVRVAGQPRSWQYLTVYNKRNDVKQHKQVSLQQLKKDMLSVSISEMLCNLFAVRTPTEGKISTFIKLETLCVRDKQEVWIPISEAKKLGEHNQARAGTGAQKIKGMYVRFGAEMLALKVYTLAEMKTFIACRVPAELRATVRITPSGLLRADAVKFFEAGRGCTVAQLEARWTITQRLPALPSGFSLLPGLANIFAWPLGGLVLKTREELLAVSIQVYHSLEYLLSFILGSLTGQSNSKLCKFRSNLSQQIEMMQAAKTAGCWRIFMKRCAQREELIMALARGPWLASLLGFRTGTDLKQSGEGQLTQALGLPQEDLWSLLREASIAEPPTLHHVCQPLIAAATQPLGWVGKRVFGSSVALASLVALS